MSATSTPAVRALMRLAWRESMRDRGRTALVVSLVALPVACMFLGSALVRMHVESQTAGIPWPWNQLNNPDAIDSGGAFADGMTLVVAGGSLALVAFATVMAAAFGVSARKQLRMIGIVEANGASAGQVRAAFALQGAITGLIGAIVGLAAGTVMTMFVGQGATTLEGDSIGQAHAATIDYLWISALAVLVCATAAWIPGRNASSTPVLAALAGRRPVDAIHGDLPIVGIGVFLCGCAALHWYVTPDNDLAFKPWVAGALSVGAILIGGLLIVPWIVSRCERLTSRLRGAARLSARGLYRNRGRTASVVAAIAAVLGLGIASYSIESSRDQMSYAEWAAYTNLDVVYVSKNTHSREPTTSSTHFVEESVPLTLEEIDAMTRIVPGIRFAEITSATIGPANEPVWASGAFVEQSSDPFVQYQGVPQVRADGTAWVRAGSPVLVAGPEALGVLGGSRSNSASIAALNAGKAVVFDPRIGADGKVSLASAIVHTGRPSESTIELEAVVDSTIKPARWNFGPRSAVMISPETAARLGLESESVGTLGRATSDFTDAQRDQLDDLNKPSTFPQVISTDGSTTTDQPVFRFDEAYQSGMRTITIRLFAIGALLSFAIVAVGLALASADGKDERELLVALGAPPRTRRLLAAYDAAALCALGTLIAIPAGLVPAVVIGQADPALDVSVPWRMLLAVIIVLPLVCAAGAARLTKHGPPALTRRIG